MMGRPLAHGGHPCRNVDSSANNFRFTSSCIGGSIESLREALLQQGAKLAA
jgi:hypothetical protein